MSQQHVPKRKRQKKRKKKRVIHKGRTAKEEKELRESLTFGQSEIAEYLDCDRSTIARYCREGLPFERTAHGKEHRIELRTAIHWSVGHNAASERGLELSVLEKILWALAMQEVAFNKHASFDKWKADMLKTFDWFPVTPQELSFSIGKLFAFDCFTFRDKRW